MGRILVRYKCPPRLPEANRRSRDDLSQGYVRHGMSERQAKMLAYLNVEALSRQLTAEEEARRVKLDRKLHQICSKR